jgi:hypothetical protein
MPVITVLRPTSVVKAGAGTSVPSGTLAAVTADNSDSTYINMAVASSGTNWVLRVGSHTPSAGYGRHRIRGRMRMQTNAGACTEDISLGRGAVDYYEYDTVPVTASWAEQAGDWYQDEEFGLATVGALADLNISGGWPENVSGATALRTAECYLDVDTRLWPDYAPQVRDAAGTDKSSGTVTDTTQPVMFFGAVGYDGLPSLDWSVDVRDGTNAVVWVETGSGTPPTSVQVTSGLSDGAYTAHFQARSTIRGADPFPHAQTVSFAVSNIVPAPSPPLVSVREEYGGYRVNWVNPGGLAWDDNYVVAEVWRDDCTGSQRIATVPGGLNGSYLDLAIPQLDPQPGGVDCAVSAEACDLTYRVRYWGYVSTYIGLPSTIPDDLILGWPGTAGTIPSGWSRVTALDGIYPRGSSGTGAPSATGGTTSHSHTTPSHTHAIGAHNHSVTGSTGTSNASTTSARFNGASQPQADQPHSHARPSATGTGGGGNSGSASPGTNSVNNVPLSRDVIWIASNGAQVAYPVGVLGWSAESVSGWTADATSSGRFLKGAAAAGNGGASSGAATHTHSVASHTHTGITHDHSIGSTGLSNPASSQEAGTGSQTPRWLPRHTHPMDVSSAGTGSLNSAGGGTTGDSTLEPPHRRLRVLRNTAGGIQTRIIGLYTGTVAGLDPLLTLCDGRSGTPDMRGQFARDAGSDSVNSTGGAATHSHSVPSHGHSIPSHTHNLSVLASTSSSYEAPSSGDLGSSPTTGHTHSTAPTNDTTPSTGTGGTGSTNAVSHIPPYREVHFVRLDGTISGGSLAVPELKVSDFAAATVPGFTYGDDLDRLASLTEKVAVPTDRSHSFPRITADNVPLEGGLHTVATTLAGEDLSLVIAVEGITAINALEAMLANDRVYWSPLGGTPGWFAPGGWTVAAPAPGVKVLTVTMVRQPWPATPEPEEYL